MIFSVLMRVFSENQAQFDQDLLGGVLTIGNFDGIHLGHQALVHHVLDEARDLGVRAMMMTFDPHPAQVLNPERKHQRLFPRDDVVRVLESYGLDALIVRAFSRSFSQLSPRDFVKRVLIDELNPKKIVVGYDFSFGANRSGKIEDLVELGREFGFEVVLVDAVHFQGDIVSSSRIRKAIYEGNVELAHQLLGRHFYLKGLVEKGDGRGRQIGVPTANLGLISETCPKLGVYATRLRFKNQDFDAVTNIGKVPTFKEDWQAAPRVETHVLGEKLDLYGQEVEIHFVTRIRDEKKFGSVEELVAQIQKDKALASSILKNNKAETIRWDK